MKEEHFHACKAHLHLAASDKLRKEEEKAVKTLVERAEEHGAGLYT